DMRSDASKSHDPGLFVTQAILSPGVPHDEVRETILRVYEKIVREGLSAEELANAKTQLETQILFSRDGSYHMAQELSSLIASGDWALYASYLDKIRTLTQTDIQQAAQKYLQEKNMTTAYLVSKNPSPRDEQIMANAALPVSERTVTEEDLLKHADALAHKNTHTKQHPAPESFDKRLSERVTSNLVNGIRVLTIKTPIEKVVTITGSIEGAGQAYSSNPVLPEMVVNMLDEGTQRRNKFEIARLLERCGAQVAFQIGHKRASFKARCLAKDVPLVMELVSEQLRYPLFDAAEFEKQKQRLEVDITHAMSSTSDQAESSLSRLIYPEGHPYYEPPFEDQLEALKKLTRDDLVRFHQTQYSPKNIIIVAAGAVDTQLFIKTIEDGMKEWPVSQTPPLLPHAPLAMAEPQKVMLSIPDKSKFDVVLGHALPIKYGDPLYYSVFLANFILGGDFSSRLSNKVRDEYGLTYSIYSEISGVDRNNGGHWQISMILNPTVLDRGIEATLDEINSYIKQLPSAKEVEDNKATLKGMYQVSLSTTEGIASRILANEEMDLPLSHLDNYPNLISAVTPEQVNQAIKKYFHPEKFQMACAGPDEKSAE
ncbi:MAG: insulinase family protein, partial [Candidatus Omnitrophica bacterium]|nr:insulinase family protein [Candidatus Omnitrophota bacterium]